MGTRRGKRKSKQERVRFLSSIQFEQLTTPVREVIEQVMRIMDAWWDPDIGLLRETTDGIPLPSTQARHHTRDSVIYALGLLMRNRPGDAERAERIIKLVLTLQYDEPSQPYH